MYYIINHTLQTKITLRNPGQAIGQKSTYNYENMSSWEISCESTTKDSPLSVKSLLTSSSFKPNEEQMDYILQWVKSLSQLHSSGHN